MVFGTELQTAAATWLIQHGTQIAIILIVFFILTRFSHVLIENMIRRAIVSRKFISEEAERKREDTLIRVFTTVVNIVLTILASVMIFSEFGVDTGALLAGLGIAGVAVGFGAQYLVKDFITGFFVILENQYRVGDVVCVGDTCGLVEDINLRMTVLRDLDGTVHHVPNGEITIASNLTKYHANVNLNVGVSYASNIEKVIKVVNNVGEKLAADTYFKKLITKPPQFLRVDNFEESRVVIKILGETKPLKQWEVAGELRKRLLIAFEKEKIVIPYPQRIVQMVK